MSSNHLFVSARKGRRNFVWCSSFQYRAWVNGSESELFHGVCHGFPRYCWRIQVTTRSVLHPLSLSFSLSPSLSIQFQFPFFYSFTHIYTCIVILSTLAVCALGHGIIQLLISLSFSPSSSFSLSQSPSLSFPPSLSSSLFIYLPNCCKVLSNN